MKEKTIKDLSFINKPIGGDSPFVVTLSGANFAGFNTMKDARAYIQMQKDSKRTGGGVTAASQKDWSVSVR